MKESELYNPIQKYLEQQGYTIAAEVQECDMLATRDDELIIIELKSRMSLTLLIQAAQRKDISDAVYIAVPLPPGKKDLPNARGLRNLLKKLEIGLILVRFMKTKTKVDVVLHPRPYELKKRRKKQASLIREINGRYGEFHKGGISTKEERITSYKQECIRIALFLSTVKEASPREMRQGSLQASKVQPILSRNHYGWFDKVRRGYYCLNQAGRESLKRYEHEQAELIKKLKTRSENSS